MVDEQRLNRWFCEAVLPLEPALTRFIRRNWKDEGDVVDLRQEIYERALVGARAAIPTHTRQYIYTVARNHLINRAKRERIVSFELVADMSAFDRRLDVFGSERQLSARDDLRRAMAGLDRLPTRCREVILLRKVEGLTTKETAERLGISINTVEKQMTQGMRALVDHMLGGSGRIQRPKALRRRSKGSGS